MITVVRPVRAVLRIVANSIPSATGGTTDHAALASNLAWGTSGHTGTASRLAGFSGAGAAAYYQIGVDVLAASRSAILTTLGSTLTAATPVSTTDDTNGTTWCTIPVVSGKSYLVMGAVGATTALASTACNLRFAASGGATMSAGSITWAAGQSTTFAGGSTVLDAWTPLVSGLGTTERAIAVTGSWTCTGSGDVLFQVRPEVAGSSVAILGGAILVTEVA